eukprot:jgi/Undpi1/10328/HiC_scaffold_28.g12778.m1
MSAGTMPDLQGLWEKAQREVALEGSSGCTLKRLWELVKLVDTSSGGSSSQESIGKEEGGEAADPDPGGFLKGWLWRTIIARRGREVVLATYNDQGVSHNLKRGDEDDSRLAAIKDPREFQKEQDKVGVVANRAVRLRTLGLDTATLKSVTLVSPAYIQVLELVGKNRGRGATIAEILNGMNSLNNSDKKDDFSGVVVSQTMKGRGPNRSVSENGPLGSGGMTASQLYPVYDRLVKAGLVFKSIIQSPVPGEETCGDLGEGLFRFVVLYLTRFKDAIELPEGSRLEPTAKEVFLEKIVDHLLEVGGPPGAIVPWHNLRKDLFLKKRASDRVKNYLVKETNKPDFPIRIQMLDARAMQFNPSRRSRVLEPCISLKSNAALFQEIWHEGRRDHGQKPRDLRHLERLHQGGGRSGSGKQSLAEGEGGLDDVNWSDDEALDALVDKMAEEVQESESKEDSFRHLVLGRVKFEVNPVYPPEGSPEETKLAWMQMTPKDRRKYFIQQELDKCTAVTTAKLGCLIRMLEGPGPSMHKHTLGNLAQELVQEGKIKRAMAPTPECQEWRTPLKSFGCGDMLVHISAETDEASMRMHVENYYRLEMAVSREITLMKEREVLRGKRYKWDVSRSKSRFHVYRRRVHRTMMLHRELLRCLPRLTYRRVGSRAIDLDRVILDIPLSIFLTMFGFPDDYLHSEELHKVIKGAENKKSTIRRAPRAVWELIRAVPWYKDALVSSLRILHDMNILTRIDPPSTNTSNSAASTAAPAPDPFAYSHCSVTEVPATGETGGAEAGVTVEGGREGGGGKGRGGRGEGFRRAMAKAAAVRKDGVELSGAESGALYMSMRGMRRDKRARTAATEALLNAEIPPGEIKMGLGWACLHVDVAVYTEDKAKTVSKKVSDHIQWCDFWSTYQFYGTGRREEYMGRRDDGRKMPDAMEGIEVAHPLASWLLAKVPYLTEVAEWGATENEVEVEERSAWHRLNKIWTSEQDMALITAVRRFQPNPTYSNSRPVRPGAAREESVNTVRQALRPVADWVGKTPESCWKRYKKLVKAQARYAEHGAALPLPMVSGKRGRGSAKAKGVKRPLEEGEDKEGDPTLVRKRKPRHTGLLARDGPLLVACMDSGIFKGNDLDEERAKAREEAAIAKAVGFEWVNEEGSWDEDGRGGGILPRLFGAWEWSIEELAAFTAVRQLMLVPEQDFNPEEALKRMAAFRPPTLQKAYRALLSFKQIDIVQVAWAANEYSVQDCVDHEVYKIIGRHGTNMVTRGIIAAEAFHSYGFEPDRSNPLLVMEGKRDASEDALRLKLKRLCGSSVGLPREAIPDHKETPDVLSVKDIGLDQGMVNAVLEAIARGRAGFTVRALVGENPEETTGAGSANNGSHGERTPVETQNPRDDPPGVSAGASASLGGEGQASKGGEGGEDSQGQKPHVDAVVGGGGQGRGAAGITRTPPNHFRCTKPIDGDIMGTLVAEVVPLAEARCEKGVGHGSGSEEDALEVYGPDMEWRSTGNPTHDVNDDVMAGVREALEEVGEKGLTLVQLKRAVRAAARSKGSAAEENQVRSFIGRALRKGTIVGMCGAVDARYILEEYTKAWAVPSSPAVNPSSEVPPTSSPTPMETDSAGQQDDEDLAASSAAAKGWKGKGKQRAGSARRNVVTTGTQSRTESKVFFPWMNFEGEVNLRLLNRIRYGLVSYTRTNPGSLASKIRQAEVPFLTEGETKLLLRDLVRRKVLREQTVPDVSTATLSGGWGMACTGEMWTKGNGGVLDEEAGAGLTTSYSPSVNWADMMKRIKGMPLSSYI